LVLFPTSREKSGENLIENQKRIPMRKIHRCLGNARGKGHNGPDERREVAGGRLQITDNR